MIVICRRGKTYITLRGHAGSGPYGHDLICAAVSALALTLAANIAGMEQPVIRLQPGDTELSCVPTLEAVQVFDCLWKGFETLVQLYPEHLELGVRSEE